MSDVNFRNAALHDATIMAHFRQYERGLVEWEEMLKLLVIALAKEKRFYQIECNKLINSYGITPAVLEEDRDV